jgi:hypothetical protein
MPNLCLVNLLSFHPSVLLCIPSSLHHLIPPPRGRSGETNLSATCFASCGWLLPVSSLMEFVAILSVCLSFLSTLQFSISSLFVCIPSRFPFSLSFLSRMQIGFWQGFAAKQRNERMSWLAFLEDKEGVAVCCLLLENGHLARHLKANCFVGAVSPKLFLKILFQGLRLAAGSEPRPEKKAEWGAVHVI